MMNTLHDRTLWNEKNDFSHFLLCFLLQDHTLFNFVIEKLNSSVLRLTIIRSCGRQSKAQGRSVRRPAKVLPLSSGEALPKTAWKFWESKVI